MLHRPCGSTASMLLAIAAALSPFGAGAERSAAPAHEVKIGVVHEVLPPARIAAGDLQPFIAEAARRGARYVVVPEPDLEHVRIDDASVETVPGATTGRLGTQARALGVWIAAPVLERADEGFYRTAVLVDPDGALRAKHRKVLVRAHGEDGAAQRGYRWGPTDTYDDGPLRVGLADGTDVEFLAPRLLNRGADLVLVVAGHDDAARADVERRLTRVARNYTLALTVAPPRPASGVPHAVYGAPSAFADGGDGPISVVAARVPVSPRIPVDSLGLPATLPIREQAAHSRELVEVGRRLFLDPKLSGTGDVACSTCHDPRRAFSNGRPLGVGVYGRKTTHNVPSLLNVAFRPVLRWTGDVTSLEDFTVYPVNGPNEMGSHYVDGVMPYVRSQPSYAEPLQRLLGVKELLFDHVSQALAAYQRTLISAGSPFDRFYFGGDRAGLDAAATRGLELFTGKAKCASCHPVERTYATFTDAAMHEMPSSGGLKPVLTPGLRDVARTAPYFHDGRLRTLREVVDFFDRGGRDPRVPDVPALAPLRLAEREKQDLVSFLEALTGTAAFDSAGRSMAGDTSARRE